MKRLILSICASAILLPCYGQSRGRIGVGVTEMLTKEAAGIYIGHSLSPKWSIESEAVFKLPHHGRSGNEEWKEHVNEFTDEVTKEKSQVPARFTVSLRHWKHSAYDGGCILVGITQYEENLPVIHTGAAYCMKLCRHIGLDLSFRINLKGYSTSKAITGNGITLTIDYLF